MHVGPTSSTQPRDSRSPVAASHGVQDGFCPESQVAVLSAAGCELHLCPELKKRAHTHTHTHTYLYIYTQSTSIHIYIHMMTAMYIRYMKINMILHYITSHYERLYIHILAAYTVYYAPQWIGDASGQWRWGTTWVWKSGFQVLSPTHLCMRVSLFPVSQICWWETGEYTFPAHSDK